MVEDVGETENPSGELSTGTTRSSLDHHGDIENQNPQSPSPSHVEEDAAAAVNENSAGNRGNNGSVVSFAIVPKVKRASMNAKVGILALMDDEVDDEKNGNNRTATASTTPATAAPTTTTKAPGRAYIPFPSIDELSMHNKKWDFDDANGHEFDDSANQMYDRRNVCPCRCFFFTLMETMCLVMSLLGCAVFLAGLVALCLFLEGSYVNGDQ